MIALFWLIDTILSILSLFILISIILSWLTAFNIINGYQPFVRTVMEFLHTATEPILSRIRQIVPSAGGMDWSGLIALLLIHFLRLLLRTSIAPALGVYGY